VCDATSVVRMRVACLRRGVAELTSTMDGQSAPTGTRNLRAVRRRRRRIVASPSPSVGSAASAAPTYPFSSCPSWVVMARRGLRPRSELRTQPGHVGPMQYCILFYGAITSKIKHTMKHKTSLARLARLLQPSLAFCFSLQPMTANCPVVDGTPSLAAS